MWRSAHGACMAHRAVQVHRFARTLGIHTQLHTQVPCTGRPGRRLTSRTADDGKRPSWSPPLWARAPHAQPHGHSGFAMHAHLSYGVSRGATCLRITCPWTRLHARKMHGRPARELREDGIRRCSSRGTRAAASRRGALRLYTDPVQLFRVHLHRRYVSCPL